MTERESARAEEIQVMTMVETVGGCSNANMCHRIGLMGDHAKVRTTTPAISDEETSTTACNQLFPRRQFIALSKHSGTVMNWKEKHGTLVAIGPNRYYCSFKSICPEGVHTQFDLLEHLFAGARRESERSLRE